VTKKDKALFGLKFSLAYLNDNNNTV
jgi:hypothetical protein